MNDTNITTNLLRQLLRVRRLIKIATGKKKLFKMQFHVCAALFRRRLWKHLSVASGILIIFMFLYTQIFSPTRKEYDNSREWKINRDIAVKARVIGIFWRWLRTSEELVCARTKGAWNGSLEPAGPRLYCFVLNYDVLIKVPSLPHILTIYGYWLL